MKGLALAVAVGLLAMMASWGCEDDPRDLDHLDAAGSGTSGGRGGSSAGSGGSSAGSGGSSAGSGGGAGVDASMPGGSGGTDDEDAGR